MVRDNGGQNIFTDEDDRYRFYLFLQEGVERNEYSSALYHLSYFTRTAMKRSSGGIIPGATGKEISRMLKKFAAGVAIVIALTAGVSTAADSGKEKAAVAAAEKWLATIDEGDYSQSWKEAADYFKAAVSREQWEQSLQAVRKPFGKIISRKVKSATFTTTLPGAPDGEYVIIQFDTSFEHKKSAVETVTPMREKDGHWRVSGYYIK
jgi:hypothetical protein